MTIQCLQQLTPELKAQVIRLLGDHYYKHVLWEWQFEQIPQAQDVRLIIAQEPSGAVLGFNGSLPVRVQIGGESMAAHWSCDFIVASNARGHGVGKSMKKALVQQCPIIMASGISSTADHVHHRLGWTRATTIPRYSKIVRMQRLRDLIRIALQASARLTHIWANGTRARTVTCEIVDAQQVPPEALSLWERVGHEYPYAVVRSAEYLDWRYRKHPLMHYRAIIAREDGVVRALAFFWTTPRRAALVDFIGPSHDTVVAHEVVKAFVTEGVHGCAAILECSTTHSGLQQALKALGFLAWRNGRTICNVYPADLAGSGAAWFMMGGDSDGDILMAARAGSALTVERWSEQQFLAAREEWNGLLARSTADRLFLGWEWQAAWWSTYARRNRLQMHCLAVRDRHGRLVGLAPLYFQRTRWRGLFSRRLQFIGNIWQGPATMRTEYLEFLGDHSCAEHVAVALFNELAESRAWDDMVLTDLDERSVTQRILDGHALQRQSYLRYVARHTGYGIDTSGSWDDYLRGLSGNQRRKLFLQRRQLQSRGNVNVECFDGTRFEEFADRLDRLHALRWGRAFFRGQMREFHRQFLRNCDTPAVCHGSILQVDGRDVSALYNVRIGKREYNLQGGFDEHFMRGVSVALLHLGYVIERAFADGIERVELLVGGGKKGDFKSTISSVVAKSTAIHIVRDPARRHVHRLYDRVRRGRMPQ
jgi:hypothetical protein